MQTFLPYKSFIETAKCLDMKRLGKQRVETLQLLNAIYKGAGWKNHPAARMWKNYGPALIGYGLVICSEWIRRGYKDTCFDKIQKFITPYTHLEIRVGDYMPSWLTDEFCNSHRSNLLRKKPEYYSKFNWQVPDNLPYIWPVRSK